MLPPEEARNTLNDDVVEINTTTSEHSSIKRPAAKKRAEKKSRPEPVRSKVGKDPPDKDDSSQSSSSSSSTSSSSTNSSTDYDLESSEDEETKRSDVSSETHVSSSGSFTKSKKAKIARLSSKIITILSRCQMSQLKLRGSTQERTSTLDAWMDKIRLVAYQHDAMSCVFDKFTTDRTLVKPRAKWVDAALFSVLQLYVDASTRQALDPTKINTKSGVDFWNLLKLHALGDETINRENAYRRFISCSIKPGQLYPDFIEHVQRNVFVCRQCGDKITDGQIVRVILTGLKGTEHKTHVSALLAWQVQASKLGKALKVQDIQEYFRLAVPSTDSTIRSHRNGNAYRGRTTMGYTFAPRAAYAAIAAHSNNSSTQNTTTKSSHFKKSGARKPGRPAMPRSGDHYPAGNRVATSALASPRNNGTYDTNVVCTHCLHPGHKKEKCYSFLNGRPPTSKADAVAHQNWHCVHCNRRGSHQSKDCLRRVRAPPAHANLILHSSEPAADDNVALRRQPSAWHPFLFFSPKM